MKFIKAVYNFAHICMYILLYYTFAIFLKIFNSYKSFHICAKCVFSHVQLANAHICMMYWFNLLINEYMFIMYIYIISLFLSHEHHLPNVQAPMYLYSFMWHTYMYILLHTNICFTPTCARLFLKLLISRRVKLCRHLCFIKKWIIYIFFCWV